MASRFWKCRKCGWKNERKFSRCQMRVPILLGDCVTEHVECTGRRPPARIPKHREIMAVPYEKWVEQFGEVCGICGRKPAPTDRRLDRDHDHKTGAARGLLCWLCNKKLDDRVTVDWLLNAAKYLDRDPIQRL